MVPHQNKIKTEKLQKRAARFADTLDNKKARSEPLTLQINTFIVSEVEPSYGRRKCVRHISRHFKCIVDLSVSRTTMMT